MTETVLDGACIFFCIVIHTSEATLFPLGGWRVTLFLLKLSGGGAAAALL